MEGMIKKYVNKMKNKKKIKKNMYRERKVVEIRK
jgi:hypothetical protein